MIPLMASSEDAPSGPTFSRDIAPIVYKNCVVCHRTNQAAPFSLTSYEQVSRRARLSSRVIETGYMPPWKPASGHGDFFDERRLTSEEIAIFREWASNGKPEGDPDDLPELPVFPERWQLGEPDLIVKMDQSFTIPADGPDIYRNFIVDTGLDEEVWIRAVELIPKSPRVVHHVLVFADEMGVARALDERDDTPGFSEMIPPSQLLGTYVPGATPRKLTEGLSRRLPKGSPLVLQTHFHPTGKEEVEQLEVGIYLSSAPSQRSIVDLQLPELFGIGMGIDIPAGADEYRVEHEVTLPVDCEAIAVGGHAHYIGKEMKLTATFPDGTKNSLFYIDDWDLDWQGNYTYREPMKLPRGTILKATVTYDNSEANTNNPYYPPRQIRWGKESTDEMGSIALTLIPAKEKDAKVLKKLAVTEKKRALVGLFNGGKVPQQGEPLKLPSAAAIIKTFDHDDSNGLSIAEFPPLPARDRFDRLDENGDAELDEKELDSMVRMMNLAMKLGLGEGFHRSRIAKHLFRKQLGIN